jgi:hypothetical protein
MNSKDRLIYALIWRLAAGRSEFLSGELDQSPLNGYHGSGMKEPRLRQVHLVQCDIGVVTTQSWERNALGRDVDASVDDAQTSVPKYLTSRNGQKSGKHVL